MKGFYEFLGGRKMTVFYLLVALSGALWFFNREITADQLFRFWEWVTVALVLGNVGSKFAGREK